MLDGGPYEEHVEASHGTYNIQTETGKFYTVIGTVGFRAAEDPLCADHLESLRLHWKNCRKAWAGSLSGAEGTVTTCELPHPKWQFNARRISVDVDSTAKIYYSKFRLMGVPVFYFPFVTHPVQKNQRQSGIADSQYWELFDQGIYRRRIRLLGFQSQHGRDGRAVSTTPSAVGRNMESSVPGRATTRICFSTTPGC